MRIQNPTHKAFFNTAHVDTTSDTMTIQGTVSKLKLLLGIMLTTATLNWLLVANNYHFFAQIGMVTGIIGGFILSFATLLKPTWAKTTAPLYAACQGLAMGGFSAFAEQSIPGISLIVLGLTAGTAAALLLAYQFNLVKATENVKLMILAATGGVGVTYTLSLVLRLFGVNLPFINDYSIYGIFFSIVVVGIAAFNLVLDFNFIEQAAEEGMPKYMEWYGAFTVLVTLVWLYLEFFRLALKVIRRNT